MYPCKTPCGDIDCLDSCIHYRKGNDKMIRLLEIIDGYTVAIELNYDKLGLDWSECRISKGDYSATIEFLQHNKGIYNCENDDIELVDTETISKIQKWIDEN